ncbi:MAG: hypothetical protein GWN76_24420 [candidate division Zixibacteria bacterium]|nr:hypothetical protein [candidate division Zixibacteria bacterium]NIS48982.1 hypothetical protein [candidate division Zixibacteria bacterium]NIU17065.1 hypothetical protein [candidate division Zixibacteria bacterium]NIW97066.1 hypothetical protein [Phycisphaerae bacterium]
MAIKLKWNGKGSLHGVRAKDLSEEEIKKYGYDEKALIASGLYSLVEKPKSSSKSSKSSKPEEIEEKVEAVEAEALEDKE